MDCWSRMPVSSFLMDHLAFPKPSHFMVLSTLNRDLILHTFSRAAILYFVLIFANPLVKNVRGDLICISLMSNEVELLILC